MWESPPEGDFYFQQKIGLERGLFALAYHIDFELLEEPCICDVCGNHSEQSIKKFSREKYTGFYGSTKNGREGGAGWWPHPYTPTTKKEEGVLPLSARGHKWQSWQHFTAYVIDKETEKSLLSPAPIIQQYKGLNLGHANLLVGGNIADQGSVIGRVYDLYSMPENWNKSLDRVTKVIDEGLMVKEALSRSLNKIFGIGYEKHFVSGIKEDAMQQFISNAQIIIQELLLDVNRKEAAALRKAAFSKLRDEAISIHKSLTRKYQNDLPLFKALTRGESVLRLLKSE